MMCAKKTIICAALAALTGCAVSPSDVSGMRATKQTDAEALIAKAGAQRKQESPMVRIDGNFVGDLPIDLPYAAKLPPVFFEEISLRATGTGYGTLSQAARNLSLATGVPVRTTPDVDMPPPNIKSGVGGAGASPQSQSLDATKAGALQTMVRMSYRGTFVSYVKQIAETAGVDWEWRDGSVVFSRVVTKTFHLANVNPGDVQVSDSMTKGGSTQTGQNSGSQGGGQTGTFSTGSSVGMEGKYSVWAALKPALDGALTTIGKVSVNEATGTVTVTDTKDAVERVRKIIDREDTIMGRQVSIDVRTIRISLNKQTQAGFDLNAVYTILSAAGAPLASISSAAPASVASSTAGGMMTFSVTDATSRWLGSKAGLQAVNQFGTIVSDSTSSVTTTNRVPAMTGAYNTQGFLAQTTPASGGAVSGGQGVPGLTPGSVTTGSFLRVLPTVRDNNTIMLNMSVDLSNLLGFGSAKTGSGQTEQQIQWANTDGTKTTSNLVVNQGESMVMVGVGQDSLNADSNNGIGGASANATKNRAMFIVVVTPRIMKGL